jgi:Bacterial SH3 domain
MIPISRAAATLGAAIALATVAASATTAQDIRTEPVHFAAGRSSARISGSIAGYESVSYVLGAEAGQTMTVALDASNGATYFNVYAPGSGPGDQALASSGLTGPAVPELNRFAAELPASGEYTISVYMMRAAARRDERSDYTLDIAVAGAADMPTGPVVNDFADGLQGGPDHWRVRTGDPAGRVNLRAAPSTGAAVLQSVPAGTVLRNLGCRMAEGRRWCQVETPAPAVTGWMAGDFLVEGSPD